MRASIIRLEPVRKTVHFTDIGILNRFPVSLTDGKDG